MPAPVVDKEKITEALNVCNKSFDGLNVNEVMNVITELLVWTIYGFRLDESDIGIDGIMTQLNHFTRQRLQEIEANADPNEAKRFGETPPPTLQ